MNINWFAYHFIFKMMTCTWKTQMKLKNMCLDRVDVYLLDLRPTHAQGNGTLDK